jgi:hypothetical protein
MTENAPHLEDKFYRLAIEDEGRSCSDISESACNHQAGNFSRHVSSLFFTKTADGLIDPKLVLSWLMTHLGASSLLIGLLVPIREAGALLPQLFTAGALRQIPKRKWAWSLGAAIQGISALSIVLLALLAPQSWAPIAILIALAILAIARSVCSVCYKDVLGKTIAKSRRGTATGLATSLSGFSIMIFALLLIIGPMSRFSLVVGAIVVGGAAFIMASLIFATLSEDAGEVEGGRSAIRDAVGNLSYLRTEPQLRLFIIVRGLLTATALAPPFIVAMSEGSNVLQTLGFFVLASATASLISGWVWGRISDRSSRQVLILTGFISAIILGAIVGVSQFDIIKPAIALPVALFVLMLAYQGVRLGRSTHLVDMASETTRAAFTALSNTIIGVLLLLGAGFGLVAETYGTNAVLLIMALMCALAAVAAFRLDEVQQD